MFQVGKMQFKLTPYPWTVLGVPSQSPFPYRTYVKDLYYVFFGGGGGEAGGWKKNLVKAVVMGVYSMLAANYIQKRVKKWRRSKTRNQTSKLS